MQKFLATLMAIVMVLALFVAFCKDPLTAYAAEIVEIPVDHITESAPAATETPKAVIEKSEAITETPDRITDQLDIVTAADRQVVLHRAAELLRNELGYSNHHAAVRVLSETWWAESGIDLGSAYYYSAREGARYYLDEAKNAETDVHPFLSQAVNPRPRQLVAAEVVRMLSAVYDVRHPVVVAAYDIVATEGGLGCGGIPFGYGSYYAGRGGICYEFTNPSWYTN